MKNQIIKKTGIIFFSLIMFTLLAYALTFATDFNEGTYTNTEYNGSAVILVGENLTGDYTSKIFDAGDDATWNNISWTATEFWELLDNKQGSLMSGNVLLMHMNEASEIIVDYSGEGNNGTYNGALYSQTGKLNTAIGFDGIDDVVTVSNDPSLSINTSYSISAWINPKNVGGMQTIVSKGNAIWEMNMIVQNGVLSCGFENCADDNFLGNGGTIVSDSWQHVAYVYNGSRVLGYIDGVEVINVDGSGTPCVRGHSLGIGDSQHGISYPFNGTIDEVAIWNRSLSADEILESYKQGALKLNLTARSCDNSNCNGESFIDIEDDSPQNLSVNDNQYFQYKFLFETENVNYSPELYAVTIDYTILNTAPIVTLENPINNYNSSIQEITFICSALDNESLSNITLYGSWSGGWHANETKSLTGTSNSTTFTKTLSYGTYVWNCLAYDGGSLNDFGDSNFTFTISGEGIEGFEEGTLIGEFDIAEDVPTGYPAKKELAQQIIIGLIVGSLFIGMLVLLVYLIFKFSK